MAANPRRWFSRVLAPVLLVFLTAPALAQQTTAPNADADVPRSGLSGLTKEEFLRERYRAASLRRGLADGISFDPRNRGRAIAQMQQQEQMRGTLPDPAFMKRAVSTVWVPLGPSPIPNGQSNPSRPVSGRVTAIAVHPSNPDIAYVGAAQGGVYRTLDGGVTWEAMMDDAQSLAIGSIAIAPSSPSTVYVGTGEPNFSADSYFGVGVYRIDGADTISPTLVGPLNLDGLGEDVFTGRSISEILVHPSDPATIFVSSTSGIAGLRPTTFRFPNRGIYRSFNATSGAPTFEQIGVLPDPNDNISVRDIAFDPLDPNIMVASLIADGGGIYRSTDALAPTPTWTNTLTLTGGTSSLATEFDVYHGATVDATFYAASGFGGGRVYVSTDGGASWALQIDNNFCTPQCFYDIAIAVDPTNGQNVYLGGSPQLIIGKSTNGGLTFAETGVGVHVDTHALAVSPSNPLVVYLGTDGGIYKSVDAGLTWTSLNNTTFSATQFMSIDVHPTDPNFSIGGTQDNGTNFYRPDGTWIRADFGDGGFAAIDQNAPDVTNVRMYHTYFNAVSLQGYGTVSNTGSASDGNWSFRGCQFSGGSGNGITCNGVVNFYAPLERGPGNPNTIYYGSDRLYRSDDTGLSHTVVSQNPIVSGVPISSIGISPQNDDVRIVGLNNGAIYGTSTGSSTLLDLDAGNAIPDVVVNRTIVDPNDPNVAYVTLSAFEIDTVWKTSDLSSANPTWVPVMGTGANVIPQIPVSGLLVDPLNSGHVYAGTDIGVYFSSDGGTNWIPFGTGLPRVAVFDIALSPNRMIRVATHGRGFWEVPATPVDAPLCDAGGPYLGIADSPVFFDGSGSSDPGGTIVSYAWDFGDGATGTGSTPSHTYTAAGSYTVRLCVTDDLGQESCCETTAEIDDAVGVAMASMTSETSANSVTLKWSTAGPIATGFHVFRAHKEGGTAERLTADAIPASSSAPGSYEYVDRDVQSGDTYLYQVEVLGGSGSQRFDFPPITVGQPLAAGIVLRGNNPNPFNPSTTIAFELGAAGYTELTVYDARGAVVRILLSEDLVSGAHFVDWDGRDASGNTVGSGVYRYRVDSGGKRAVGTMVLLK